MGESVIPDPSLSLDVVSTRDADARSILASLVLHAILLLGIVTWHATSSPPPPVEEEIPVELLTPGQFEAITTPLPGSEVIDRPAEDPTTAPAMIRPTRMLSALALADPLSRQAREMLPSFNGTERMVQLCNLEAMEQVHAWRPDIRPERIVAYAMADLSIQGGTITAEGAAFRSAGRWYNLRFSCVLSADGAAVRSFAFEVGDVVPEAERAAHDLLTKD